VTRDFFDPNTKIGRLRRACLDKLLEHEHDGAIPTNGRFIFYELEQDGVIPKHYLNPDGSKRARPPAQDITDALTDLRKAREVPWEWLVDETREVSNWRFAASVRDYLLASAESARLDCWDGEPAPFIVCEARSTKGVLERIAAEYLAPITATNGQSGGFIVTDMVPLLQGNDREVLYIGDHEMRGPADQIEANTRSYIEDHAGRVVTWTRIALTQEQVEADPRLLGLVIVKHYRRYKPPRDYKAVECEAVGQTTLEYLLRSALEARLPAPLADVQQREDAERAKLIRYLRRFRDA
jgi:hypothetical protein